MFVYKIKPNKTELSRYGYHRIVESMFSKSLFHILDDGMLIVLTEDSNPNQSYDGSVVLEKEILDLSFLKESSVFYFTVDVYAQCLIDNKLRSVPKDKVADWMLNKLQVSGFEVMNIETSFLGCKLEQISKNKNCPTPINRFCGYLKIVDELKAIEAIRNGFGKRKHLGLGFLRLF